METRQLRRAAERQAAKQANREAKSASTTTSPATDRAEINRANAEHSTGPKTPEGKAISSENSFKHGLYSKKLVMQNENPAELDALKADLRSEHQPANTTEEILVNELAEQFWRIRRLRIMERNLLESDKAYLAMTSYMPVILRILTSAERGLHKSLAALRQLQRDRGFVPQKVENDLAAPKSPEPAQQETGFVPQNASHEPPQPPTDPELEAVLAEQALLFKELELMEIELGFHQTA